MMTISAWDAAVEVLGGPMDAFVIALEASVQGKSIGFGLWVEAFRIGNESQSGFVKHTSRREEARRMRFTEALDAAEYIKELRLVTRIEPA